MKPILLADRLRAICEQYTIEFCSSRREHLRQVQVLVRVPATTPPTFWSLSVESPVHVGQTAGDAINMSAIDEDLATRFEQALDADTRFAKVRVETAQRAPAHALVLSAAIPQRLRDLLASATENGDQVLIDPPDADLLLAIFAWVDAQAQAQESKTDAGWSKVWTQTGGR